MPNFGVAEWVIILIIVLVIFGASRLKDIGSGLGGAINAFRREVKAVVMGSQLLKNVGFAL